MGAVIAYISKDGFLYFQEKGTNLVFRSIQKFESDPRGSIRYEWEIFGLPDSVGQPHLLAYDIASKMKHPEDCVLDVDATINSLRYRVLHNSLLQNLRQK